MKMKKIIALMLCCIMVLSLAGCLRLPLPRRNNPSTEEITEERTEEKTEDTEEETEDTEEKEDKKNDSNNTGNAGDVSNAIKFGDTTAENPVPLGQWGEFTMHSSEDSKFHTIYVRISNVVTTTQDEAYIKSCIDAHNEVAYDFQQIDLSEITIPSDVECCILEYEVYIPENFPTGDYVPTPEIWFSASNVDGGGIPSADGASTYIGMGSMEELEGPEQDYVAGKTYTLKSLYFMVKGFEDYNFEYYSYSDGTDLDDDGIESIYAHWASH